VEGPAPEQQSRSIHSNREPNTSSSQNGSESQAAAAIDIAGALGLVDMTMAGVTPTATGGTHTPVIAKIISLCGFPVDSTMVRYIDQQEWTELEHVTSIAVGEIKGFVTF
jgi:hypothetical protein